MTAVEDRAPQTFVDNDQKPVGHGRMLRKEDPRFIRGKGRYVDDMQLPGMLHLAILRSPVAHARIVNIDITAAQAHPKVKLVVTGAMLAEKGLAWMPTLSNDVQAVLARAAARGRRPQGPRPGRAGDPRRQGRQDGQPLLRLGDR